MVKVRREINICRGLEGNIRPYSIKKIVKFNNGLVRIDSYFLSGIRPQKYEYIEYSTHYLSKLDIKFIEG